MIEDFNILLGKDIKEFYNILGEIVEYLGAEYKDLDEESRSWIDLLLD